MACRRPVPWELLNTILFLNELRPLLHRKILLLIENQRLRHLMRFPAEVKRRTLVVMRGANGLR